MEIDNLHHILIFIVLASSVFYLLYRITKYAFALNLLSIIALSVWNYDSAQLVQGSLYLICPLLLINTVLYVFLHKSHKTVNINNIYQVSFKSNKGIFKIENIKRGASVIGSAGSGKTESVVYGFLKHFQKHSFCGVIHDYKDFEITEMAYPLFRDSDIPFKVISFDRIIHRVNPIAPKYLENEENVALCLH